MQKLFGTKSFDEEWVCVEVLLEMRPIVFGGIDKQGIFERNSFIPKGVRYFSARTVGA
jgi:hypothetical protein